MVGGTVLPLQEGFKIEFLMLLGYANEPCLNPVPNVSFKKIILY